MSDLIRRGFATQLTIDQFQKASFQWGTADCIVMARFHLERMGHEDLPVLPKYHNAIGAKRALRSLGVEKTSELLDLYLPRIAPATMRVGDLAALEGEAGLDGIAICNGNMLSGWHEYGNGFYNLIPQKYVGAWRA